MTIVAEPKQNKIAEVEVEVEVEVEAHQYKVIGTRPIRHDGADKVTGRALYGADIHLPNMLHGKVLRSPHAHARILAINTSRAEALPGVKAVITAADLPDIASKVQEIGEGAVNLKYISSNLMARDKVLYEGHAIAAVAAVDTHTAEAALALIEVQYELLPPVLDVDVAMADDAPILLDELRTEELGWTRGEQATNVASHIQYKRGELDHGFQEAAVIVERDFHTATVHQGYLEPQMAAARWNDDGLITIWTSTQGAHSARQQVAEILQLPVSQFRVVPMEIGGGFGGKLGIYLEPVAALLSRKAGHQPVKLAMTRTEVFKATGPTAASHIRVKMGANADGRITAAEVYMAYAAGAFPGSPVGSGARVILAPYRIDNFQIDGYDVLVNRPKSAAYRAPGSTNAAFAAETVIDELCEKLDMDPLTFRRINGAQEGDRRTDGPAYRRIGYLETVEAIQTHPHYSAPLTGKYQGRGVASGFWFNFGGKSSVSASINRDGIISLVEGSTDIGGTRTSIAMQLAETLEIPLDYVKPQVVDTDTVGYNDATGGSRTTFATGWAVYELAQQIKQQMIERLAALREVEPEQVRYAGGVFTINDEHVSFKEAVAELNREKPIVAAAAVHPQEFGPSFATHVVDVEVDLETGKVKILRYTAAQDVGRAIHPSYVEGQLQGGVAQGVGWALNEEYVYDQDGHLTNASFLDYRMPTALDLPMIDTVLVEVPNPGHPYGVRGVGEVPIVPPAAAVANAIYDAIGVRMTELPMAPDRIMKAIWEKDKVG